MKRFGFRRKKRKPGQEVPKVVNHEGYEVVTLHNNKGEWVVRYVHELVAEAFVPNPNGKKHVRHKDGDKLNNRADNLEWVD